MGQRITVLGIESSCDDTAAAIVQQKPDGTSLCLASIAHGQVEMHSQFGGVVPEIAARAHTEKLDQSIETCLAKAKLGLEQIDAIAVTSGPGLIGGVLAGVMCAKGLSAATGLPLIGVNHLAGHALTPRLTDRIEFPYLMLLVSGGHCQFLIVHSADKFQRLGGTIDDAPGEAFDKTARLLGLPQPGGPQVEKAAHAGNPARFQFPRPMLDRPDCNMSYSGLKTAILRQRDLLVSDQGGLTQQDRADLCAGFQAAVCEVLSSKSHIALKKYLELQPRNPCFAVAGGVAANTQIRSALESLCTEFDIQFLAPPLSLCTDNAAMIAHTGIELLGLGYSDDLSLEARPRWPLDQSQPALLGSGKKGAKA